jgi:hypothetical protein
MSVIEAGIARVQAALSAYRAGSLAYDRGRVQNLRRELGMYREWRRNPCMSRAWSAVYRAGGCGVGVAHLHRTLAREGATLEDIGRAIGAWNAVGVFEMRAGRYFLAAHRDGAANAVAPPVGP